MLFRSQMTKLRAYISNKGKVIDLLKKQQEELLIEAKEEIKKVALKTLKIKQKAYRNIDTLNVNIPGINNSNMDWLRGIVNGGFNLGNI